MKKLKYKTVNPETENDFLEIEMNWFDIDPSYIKFYYNEFCDWAVQNCEGRWFWFLNYKNKATTFGGNRLCFSDPSDRIKFILKFL